MASNIDTTKPEEGTATTKSVRDNFSSAKTEIETLQSRAGNLDTNGDFSGGTVTQLSTDLAIVDGGTGASSAANARSNLDVYSTGETDALVDDLSGVTDATTARSNLDVYSTGEADGRFLNETNNLSDLGDVATARGNLAIATGQTTLNTTGTTTTVSESAVTASSRILLFPRDAGAASMEGIGSYVSAVNAGSDFTVTHADYSGTRTYDYLVIG